MFIPFRLNPFYAPEGDIGGSAATEEVADLGTDDGASADPFDSLSFSIGDDEPESEEATEDEAEQKTEEVAETEEAEETKEEVKEKRTSKQAPEVDALNARTRRAEEKAAQLEREIAEFRQTQRQAAERQSQEQLQARINGQWKNSLDRAQQMRDAGYHEEVVSEYLDAQKKSLQSEEKNSILENRLNQLESNMALDKQGYIGEDP